MIKAGFYKDVDISIMSHPTTLDGCFVSTLAIEMFEVEYFGKAAHAVFIIWYRADHSLLLRGRASMLLMPWYRRILMSIL